MNPSRWRSSRRSEPKATSIAGVEAVAISTRVTGGRRIANERASCHAKAAGGGAQTQRTVPRRTNVASRGKPDVVIDQLVEALQCTAKIGDIAAKIFTDRIQVLESRLRDVTRQLKARGGDIRSMDGVDLYRARQIGLISAELADEEMQRRREEFSTTPRPRPSRFSFDQTGAVIAGELPCSHSGCSRILDLSIHPDGRCEEHKQAEPRVVLHSGMGMTTSNLDVMLTEAEERLARARAEADQQASEVESIKRQIADYDEQRARRA
jgi:hypothetical protein